MLMNKYLYIKADENFFYSPVFSACLLCCCTK